MSGDDALSLRVAPALQARAAGDTAPFARLLGDCHSKMAMMAMMRVRDWNLAEDVAQTVTLHLLTSPDVEIPSGDAFWSFLKTCVSNASRDAFRGNNRKWAARESMAREVPDPREAGLQEQALNDNLFEELVEAARRRAKPVEWEAYKAVRIGRMSVQEYGDSIGLNPGNVTRRIQKFEKALQGEFEKKTGVSYRE